MDDMAHQLTEGTWDLRGMSPILVHMPDGDVWTKHEAWGPDREPVLTQALVSIPGDGYTTNAAHRFNVDDAPQLDL